MKRVLLLSLMAMVLHAQDWKLGTTQMTGFMGFNVADGRAIGAEPSVGAGLDVGLMKHLAVTTGYSWNRFGVIRTETWVLGGSSFRDYRLELRAREARHDLLGGLRVHLPGRSRVTPFIAGLGGVVVATAVASVNGAKSTDSITKPAAGVGGGFEIRVARGASFRVEAKAVRPLDMSWYGHVGFGFAYRSPGRKDM